MGEVFRARDTRLGRAYHALGEGAFDGYNGVSYWAHRSPELAPLFGYPPFEELAKPKE